MKFPSYFQFIIPNYHRNTLISLCLFVQIHSQEQDTPGPRPQLRHRGGAHPLVTGLPPRFYMSPYGAAYANQAYANQMALWYQAYYRLAFL